MIGVFCVDWYFLIFQQDPLRASDKALKSAGPYKMKEADAMVYRRPYLLSGSSGFALNAISRSMKKELKVILFSYMVPQALDTIFTRVLFFFAT